MKIRIERSGGLAGININNELDIQDLPPTLSTKLKRILLLAKSNSLKLKNVPTGAADQYHYKIIIKERELETVIECNQFNMGEDLRSLLKYIEKNSIKSKLT
ncbi:MAG TPA: protealysin inhibitor emfourin [Nitrososphaeraceae archaeon]|nr:protealysin inhibitor emfourin [Nitrososphaeraceae archaeon]